jgi:CheY-like chemotaxis protein
MDDPALMLQDEATELFKHVRSLLNDFEKKQGDTKILERLQKGFHSIKVLCTLLAIPKAAELAREIEATLAAIEKGHLENAQEIIDIINAACDQLKEEIEAELDNTPIDSTLTETLISDLNRLLPGAGKEKRTPYLAKEPHEEEQGFKILIIDDEAVSRKLLENIIRKFNKDIKIISVDTAEEGIFYYFTEHFDLVFLDIIMPVIDGNDFLAIVKRNFERGHLLNPSNIVVQTAVESMEQLLSYIKRACVQEVIRKPVTPERITDCLERYCHPV